MRGTGGLEKQPECKNPCTAEGWRSISASDIDLCLGNVMAVRLHFALCAFRHSQTRAPQKRLEEGDMKGMREQA